MKDDSLYVRHVLECIERIERYCHNGKDAGFRNVLVHDYLGISLERVWGIVSDDLPVLRVQMEAIRETLGLPNSTAE